MIRFLIFVFIFPSGFTMDVMRYRLYKLLENVGSKNYKNIPCNWFSFQ